MLIKGASPACAGTDGQLKLFQGTNPGLQKPVFCKLILQHYLIKNGDRLLNDRHFCEEFF